MKKKRNIFNDYPSMNKAFFGVLLSLILSLNACQQGPEYRFQDVEGCDLWHRYISDLRKRGHWSLTGRLNRDSIVQLYNPGQSISIGALHK